MENIGAELGMEVGGGLYKGEGGGGVWYCKTQGSYLGKRNRAV